MSIPAQHSTTINDIRTSWSDGELRRSQAARRRLMLQGDWRDWLVERILAQFLPENAEKLLVRANTDLNLFAWITGELAQIYATPPVRTWKDGAECDVVGVEVDMALDAAARYAYALGEVALRPRYIDGRVLIDAIPPDRFDYRASPDDPLALEWIVIDNTQPGPCECQQWRVWTPRHIATLDTGWVLREGSLEPNPYGVVPYTVAHRHYPHFGRWQATHADGLVEATLYAGVALTDHAHLRHHQSYKQIVIRSDQNAEQQAKLASDPASAITVRGAGGAEVLDMQADLKGHLDSLLSRIELTLQQYGIRPEIVRGTLDAASGYALSIKLGAQQRAWEQQRRLWELWEGQLWDVGAHTIPRDGGPGIPELDSIQWADLGPGSDPTELATRAASLVSAGIWSKREALRQLEYSEEQIVKIEIERADDVAATPVFAPGVA